MWTNWQEKPAVRKMLYRLRRHCMGKWKYQQRYNICLKETSRIGSEEYSKYIDNFAVVIPPRSQAPSSQERATNLNQELK